MFQNVSIERIAIALFAGALTLIAASVVFARPPVLDEPSKEKSQTIYMSMNCKEATDRPTSSFPVKFVVDMRPSTFEVTDAQVILPVIGTCGASLTGSNYDAPITNGAGKFDIHNFIVSGGQKCDAIAFTVFHDRKIGSARFASLKLGNVSYNCEL